MKRLVQMIEKLGTDYIPFNKPFMTGRELWYIAQTHTNGHLSGDNGFTKKSHAWLDAKTCTRKALLTHSCAAALEMAVLLADIQSGDEVIMPSYTFASTANSRETPSGSLTGPAL